MERETEGKSQPQSQLLSASLAGFPPVVGIDGLSILLCKKRSVITIDRSRRPHLLPPACSPAGTSKPLWIVADVIEWLRASQERPTAATPPKRRPGRPRKVPTTAR